MAQRGSSRLNAYFDVASTTVEYVDYAIRWKASWYGPPGPYDHNLLCSAVDCSEVLMEGWTEEEATREFAVALPKVGICRSRHYSVLPCHVPEPPTLKN